MWRPQYLLALSCKAQLRHRSLYTTMGTTIPVVDKGDELDRLDWNSIKLIVELITLPLLFSICFRDIYNLPNTLYQAMPTDFIGFLAGLLGSSVSVEFVILVFILGEYARLSENNESPNRMRPYKYGAIAVVATLLLSSGSIILLGVTIVASVDFKCASATLFALQLLILLGTSIFITQDILTNR